MQSLGIHVSLDDLEIVFAYLDKNKDDFINLAEFLQLDTQTNGHLEGSEGVLSQIMLYIANKLEDKFSSIHAAFKYFDTNRRDNVSRNQFHTGLDRMNLRITKSQIDQVFDHLDISQNGYIEYVEFEQFEQGAVLKERMLISRLVL